MAHENKDLSSVTTRRKTARVDEPEAEYHFTLEEEGPVFSGRHAYSTDFPLGELFPGRVEEAREKVQAVLDAQARFANQKRPLY